MTEERYVPTPESRKHVCQQLRSAAELSIEANNQLEKLIALFEQQLDRDNIERRRTTGKTG